jgi:transketolase
MRGIPGMRVFCPADAEELATALPEVVASRHPWYVRYTEAPAAVEHVAPFAEGTAETLSAGSDVAILTYGTLLAQAAGCRRILEDAGIGARLVNLRMLAPVDEAAVLEAARSSALLVTLEDHFLTGGLATIVAEVLSRNRASCRTLAVALRHRWFQPALLPDVLSHEGFTADRIADRVLAALNAESHPRSRGAPCSIP